MDSREEKNLENDQTVEPHGIFPRMNSVLGLGFKQNMCIEIKIIEKCG
jgi:hypothetical protein